MKVFSNLDFLALKVMTSLGRSVHCGGGVCVTRMHTQKKVIAGLY